MTACQNEQILAYQISYTLFTSHPANLGFSINPHSYLLAESTATFGTCRENSAR